MIPSGRWKNPLKAKTTKRAEADLQHKLALSKADQSVHTPHPFHRQEAIKKANARDKSRIRKLKSIIATPSKSRTPTRIRFDSVEVREYPLVVGDNPSITGGFPLQIDWNYTTTLHTAVDNFEQTRHEQRTCAQKLKALSTSERKARLKQMGYTDAMLRQWECRRKVIHTHEWAYGSNMKLPAFKTRVWVENYVV